MHEPGKDPELWTIGDLGAYLRMSKKAAYHLVERPDGPPVIRLGKRTVRLDPAVVRAWLAERAE